MYLDDVFVVLLIVVVFPVMGYHGFLPGGLGLGRRPGGLPPAPPSPWSGLFDVFFRVGKRVNVGYTNKTTFVYGVDGCQAVVLSCF